MSADIGHACTAVSFAQARTPLRKARALEGGRPRAGPASGDRSTPRCTPALILLSVVGNVGGLRA